MKRGHRQWQRRLWCVLAPAVAVLLVLALPAWVAEGRWPANTLWPAVLATAATGGGR